MSSYQRSITSEITKVRHLSTKVGHRLNITKKYNLPTAAENFLYFIWNYNLNQAKMHIYTFRDLKPQAILTVILYCQCQICLNYYVSKNGVSATFFVRGNFFKCPNNQYPFFKIQESLFQRQVTFYSLQTDNITITMKNIKKQEKSRKSRNFCQRSRNEIKKQEQEKKEGTL